MSLIIVAAIVAAFFAGVLVGVAIMVLARATAMEPLPPLEEEQS